MKRLLDLIAASVVLTMTAQAGLVWEQKEIKTSAKTEDTAAEAKFKFTANGLKTVTIHTTQATCGCTTAALEKKIYRPGESGELSVTFHFGSRTGLQTQHVVVRTDDPDSDAELKFEVAIPKLFNLTPLLLFWHEGEQLQPKVAILDIEAESGGKLLSATGTDPGFEIRSEEVTPGRKYKIIVTPGPKLDGPLARSIITIQTDLPAGAKASAHIYAFVKRQAR